MRPLRLLVPGNIRYTSGGNAYNARLARGLHARGVEVEVQAVEGAWPEASAKDRRRLGSLLGAWEPAAKGRAAGGPKTGETTADKPAPTGEPSGEPAIVIVDGLVAVGAPDELEYGAKAGRAPWILAHMVVPGTPGVGSFDREARAMRAAAGVIATSSSTAAILTERHRLRRVHVALPGVDPAPAAAGSSPPRIVVVAALLPNKDQLLTVEALALVRDLEWTAAFVGTDQADPGYAADARSAIARHGLEGRVSLPGELTGDPLEAEWNAADVSLLVSRAEAFGMVVTESLARGIPVVVRAGTGAEEALGLAQLMNDDGVPRLPGAAVPLVPGDEDGPAMLAGVLRRWLEDPGMREAWREAALEARDRLPGWDGTAQIVLDALAGRARAWGSAD
jgi:glycosyltransferase involved in cell wall biosynthesis